MWVGDGTMLIWRVSQQATHGYPSICHNIGIFEMCFHVDATSWVLIFVCERGKQKVKAVNVKYFEVDWFGKHHPSFLLTVWSCPWTRRLVQHAIEVALMAVLLLLPKRLSALLSATCSSPRLVVDPPETELGNRWKLWTVESCEEFRAFSSLSMQFTLWSVLPGMLRYSDVWPFILRRATNESMIKQIGVSLQVFRHTYNSTTARMPDAPSTGPVSCKSSSICSHSFDF